MSRRRSRLRRWEGFWVTTCLKATKRTHGLRAVSRRRLRQSKRHVHSLRAVPRRRLRPSWWQDLRAHARVATCPRAKRHAKSLRALPSKRWRPSPWQGYSATAPCSAQTMPALWLRAGAWRLRACLWSSRPWPTTFAPLRTASMVIRTSKEQRTSSTASQAKPRQRRARTALIAHGQGPRARDLWASRAVLSLMTAGRRCLRATTAILGVRGATAGSTRSWSCAWRTCSRTWRCWRGSWLCGRCTLSRVTARSLRRSRA
mmetsp:Transcript_28318/g.70100  ORF Transcript_28318/g.70100 Transcript_28318/m.70100 type:complete len:259 (-) Transcript_28318:228-1004(-)